VARLADTCRALPAIAQFQEERDSGASIESEQAGQNGRKIDAADHAPRKYLVNVNGKPAR